jgi:predicted transcriptional regulator
MVYSIHTMRRLQIDLDDEQILELKRLARRSRRPVSAIVREAIDDKLAHIVHEAIDDKSAQSADARFEKALSAVFGIWRDREDLGTTDEYVSRLRGRTRR